MKSLREFILEILSRSLSEEIRSYVPMTQALLKERTRASSRSNVMSSVFGQESNNNGPVIVEHITIDRILKKHGDAGFVAISACRSESSIEENEKSSAELRKDIVSAGYGYLPVYGGYRNAETGEEAEYGLSFIVFNYDAKGNQKNFDELKANAVAWCKKYRQDDVLIKAPDDIARYYKSDGNEDRNFNSSAGVFKNNPEREFFTSLKSREEVKKEIEERMWRLYKQDVRDGLRGRSKPDKKDFADWKKDNSDKLDFIGRRWTYNIEYITEVYVNPHPATYHELMKRRGSGEIMLYP